MTQYEPSKEFETQIRAAVRTPDANPEFVEHLRGRLAHIPAPRPKGRFIARPLWALGIALLLVVVVITVSSPDIVIAFRQLFSFVPGIGLVEQGGPVQKMTEPVSETRDGITLTLDEALVYPDHIELAYTVQGIPDSLRNGPDEELCLGADMYPRLRLKNGTEVAADPMALGGSRSASGYTAGHSFSIKVPSGTTSAVFLLTCLQETRRGVSPENWSVPFHLIEVPADRQPGKPLQTTNQTVEAEVPGDQPVSMKVEFTFEGSALHDDGYHVFFRFSSQSNDPDFMTVRPNVVSVLDSTGKQIELIYVKPWSPFEKVDIWEYRLVTAPAPGPLTLVIEGAQAYYLAQVAFFTFTPGPDSQIGETWQIDERFEIGGHELLVESAKKIEMEGHPGFEFVISTEEPGLRFNAELMDMRSNADGFDLWSTTGDQAYASRITPGFVYTTGTPETVEVRFNTVRVLAEGTWRLDWTPSKD